MPAGALSVTQYLEVVNATLSTIPTEAVVIEGEVAEYRVAQEKWITFLLKDETTGEKLPCFATTFQRLPPVQDGIRVQVQGNAKMNGKLGKFSLSVTALQPVGEGALKQAYEALKRMLDAEGLFSWERKRALPKYPQRIGLITSKEAAAYGDFLRILNNRHPGLTIVHANVHVQGQYAVEEIVAAFRALNELPGAERPELIVLTRGGGAFEELHAFNDERVARAVYASVLPVLVGVGHERDETLVDFIADVRASTPSNAAERVVADSAALLQDIERMRDRWREQLRYRLERLRHSLDRFTQSAGYMTATTQNRLAHLHARLTRAAPERLSVLRTLLAQRQQLLQSFNPTRVLAQGYALIRTAQGGVVRSIHAAPPGTTLALTVADGTLQATVNGNRQQPKQTSLL